MQHEEWKFCLDPLYRRYHKFCSLFLAFVAAILGVAFTVMFVVPIIKEFLGMADPLMIAAVSFFAGMVTTALGRPLGFWLRAKFRSIERAPDHVEFLGYVEVLTPLDDEEPAAAPS